MSINLDDLASVKSCNKNYRLKDAIISLYTYFTSSLLSLEKVLSEQISPVNSM